MTAPNFNEIAREWLVRATGHAFALTERSLAKELESLYLQGGDAGLERAAEVIDAAHVGSNEARVTADELAAQIRAQKFTQ